MKVQGNIITDSLGNEVEVSAFGSLKTSTPQTKIAITFDTPLDTENVVDVTETGVGTAEAQYNGNLLRIKTNGIGSAKVASKRVLEYTAGSTGGGYHTVSFHGTFGANETGYIGLYDEDNGLAIFGWNGTDWILSYRNENYPGADVVVTSDNFNGDFDIATWITSGRLNLHRVRFKYGYLGVGDITLEIKPDIPSREWKKLHIFETDGSQNERTHTGRPILPITAEVSSTAGNDVYILSGSWNAHSYASNEDVKAKKFFKRVITTGLATGAILAIRNKATFGGKTNRIRAELLLASILTGSEGAYDVVFVKNPDTITGGVWSDFKTDISVMETRENITGYTGGEEIGAIQIGVSSQGAGAGSAPQDLKDLLSDIAPNDTILFDKKEIVAGAGTDNNSLTINWKERF